MALSANAITTVAKARAYLRLTEQDAAFQRKAIDIYYDADEAATSATIEVEELSLQLVDSVTTTAPTFAANTTVTTMVATINAVTGWVAVALGHGDAATSDLIEKAATDCYGATVRQSLMIADNLGLEYVIEGVTDEIEAYLKRGIVSRSYSELYYIPNGSLDVLPLTQPNVTALNRIALDSERAFTAVYSGSDTYATVEVTDVSVILRSGTTSTPTATTSTFASNTTVGAIVTAINAVSGWSATTTTDGPSAYLVREGVRNVKSRTAQLYAWTDYQQDYVVDYGAGVLEFSNVTWPYSLGERPSTRRLLVEYTAGYSTVPDDVEQVALEMIAGRYTSAGRDDTLQSESLGDYSYSLRAPSEQSANWKMALDTYKRIMP